MVTAKSSVQGRLASTPGEITANASDEPKPSRLASVKAGRPPEAAFDAVITAKHPLIYGLISMLIDSLDKNDIEAAMRRLWTRGQEILMPPVASNATARRAKEPITPFQNSTA